MVLKPLMIDAGSPSWMVRYFPGLLKNVAVASAESFPEDDRGDVNGSNALVRMNWFNGRFLTAEALRLQDAYWDHRLRLAARAHPAGITYGLDIRVTDAAGPGYPAPYDTVRRGDRKAAGFPIDTACLALSPGLAYDGVGRPILVSSEHVFSVADLIASYRARPRRLVAGGTRFAPCVCVEGAAGDDVEAGPAIGEGAYLLVIEPGEKPAGEAKVHGNTCAEKNDDAHCQADRWRGRYGLSLVRVDVDLPGAALVRNAWDVRGVLSAYYFDVFEHQLARRWDPDFATDGEFCLGSGPHMHHAGVVPLAMLYVGSEGAQVTWVDSWIPRRTQVSTNAHDWTWGLIGAPPRSASTARVHQFQCMLDESLDVEPVYRLTKRGDANSDDTWSSTQVDAPNLHDRGFRHIPPVGILPIDPAAYWGARRNELVIAMMGLINPTTALVVAACEIAQLHFEGTNVYPYCVVAPHDDDVLEDWQNAFQKDPIQLAPEPDDDPSPYTHDVPGYPPSHFSMGGTVAHNMISTGSSWDPFGVLIDALSALRGSDLANRVVEIVKIVVPLQGTRRKDPILGSRTDDWIDTAKAWGIGPDLLLPLPDEIREKVQQPPRPIEAIPRHHVVYVKQRVVLLDLIYYLIEFINAVKDDSLGQLFGMTGTHMRHTVKADTATDAYRNAAMNDPLVRKTLLTSVGARHVDVRRPTIYPKMFEAIDAREKEILEAGELDRDKARLRAMDETLDVLVEDYPGLRAVQVLVASQSTPETAERVLRDLERGAKANPAVDERGRELADNLSRTVIGGAGHIRADGNAHHLWRLAREELELVDARNAVPDAEVGEGMRLRDMLRLSEDDARRRFGDANVESVVERTRTMAEEVSTAVDDVAAKTPPRELVARYRERKQETGSALEAFKLVKAEFQADADRSAYLESLNPVAEHLGETGFGRFADEVFKVVPRT